MPVPTNNNQASNKKYTDDEISTLSKEQFNLVKKNEDNTLTGDLILQKTYNYPIHGYL